MSEENQDKNQKKIPPIFLMVGIIAVVLGGFWLFKNNRPVTALENQPETTTAAAPLEQSITNGTQDEPTTTQAQVIAPSKPIKLDMASVMSVRSLGDKSAPIKIIEYASLTCSHCGHFHNDILPALKEKYIDTGKVYLEFREFPLNDPALKATITARCLPEDKYNAFVSLLFKTQEQWMSGMNYLLALKQNSKLAGLSEDQFNACQASSALKNAIADNMKQAQSKWKIDATPTFIINDGKERISGAVPVEEFERIFRKISDNKIGLAEPVK